MEAVPVKFVPRGYGETYRRDAWWVEPVRHGRFEMRFPFLELPNVIASPHNSAAAGKRRANGIKRAALNCLRALNGETPLHLIPPDQRAWHIGKQSAG